MSASLSSPLVLVKIVSVNPFFFSAKCALTVCTCCEVNSAGDAGGKTGNGGGGGGGEGAFGIKNPMSNPYL